MNFKMMPDDDASSLMEFSPAPDRPPVHHSMEWQIRRHLLRWGPTEVVVHHHLKMYEEERVEFSIKLFDREPLWFNIYHYEGQLDKMGNSEYRTEIETSIFTMVGDETTQGVPLEDLHQIIESLNSNERQKYFDEDWSDDQIVGYIRSCVENCISVGPVTFRV